MSNIRGIDHIGLTVPDLEQATVFFQQAFDAKVLYDTLPRSEGPKGDAETADRLGVPHSTQEQAIRMLRLPNGPGVELFEFTGPRQHDPALPCDLGWQHIALYADDLDAAISSVIDAGGRMLSEPQPLPGPEAGPRNRFVYCRTPWGSTLELLSYPDEQPYTEETSLRRWRP